MNNRKLSNGVQMPQMVIGTNWMNYDELYGVMRAGFEAGFKAIDTARDYGNEAVVGKVLHDVLSDMGMKRSDIFVTTKIGNSQQIRGNIDAQLEISLNNLQTDYIDLWLMHWPYPFHFKRTWKEMQRIYKSTDKVKAIGVANFLVRHFDDLMSHEDSEIYPMVNQIEYHPLRTVKSLTDYMDSHHIQLEAYAPLCRLVPQLKESSVFPPLERKYNKTIGQIILRWHIQLGNIPVFKSYNPSRFVENIDVFDFKLTPEEMKSISSLNIDYKYHIESCNCPGY